MKPAISKVVCCVVFFNSCNVTKISEDFSKTMDIVYLMAVITMESTTNVYDMDKEIKLNTPVFIQFLDAKFDGTTSIHITLDSLKVVKSATDKIEFMNGADMEKYLFKYLINADSAEVQVTCIYNADSLYPASTSRCISNSYSIRDRIMKNNKDYRFCENSSIAK